MVRYGVGGGVPELRVTRLQGLPGGVGRASPLCVLVDR